MLTSSNQYIQADYLSPLPNTLDSKNSPLALLAQTCSAIGSDTPNAKLLGGNQEKHMSTKSKTTGASTCTDSRDKLSPGSHSSSLSNSSSELTGGGGGSGSGSGGGGNGGNGGNNSGDINNHHNHHSINSTIPQPSASSSAHHLQSLNLHHHHHQQQQQQQQPQQQQIHSPVHQKSSFKPYESSIFRDSRSSPPEEQRSSSNNSSSQQQQQQQQQQHQHQQQPGTKTPKSHTPNGGVNGSVSGGRCESNQSASSQRGLSITPTLSTSAISIGNGIRNTPTNHENNDQISQPNSASPIQRASLKDSTANAILSTAISSNYQNMSHQGNSPYYSASKLSDSTRESTVNYPKTSIASQSSVHAAAAAAAAAAAYYNGYGGPPGLPYGMDLMTAGALMSPHHPMFKAAAMNPYMSYGRNMPKMPSTADHLHHHQLMNAAAAAAAAAAAVANSGGGICRDPYCNGCALSSHQMMSNNNSSKSNGSPISHSQSLQPPSISSASHLHHPTQQPPPQPQSQSQCPAGCTQCDHRDGPSSKSSYASQLSAAHSSVAAAYAHAQLAALAAASQLPYICNWIAGDSAYCGKRFSNSDDLLQHLRTHTSSSSSSTSSSIGNSLSSMNDSAMAMAAVGLQPQPQMPPSLPPPPSSSASHHPLFQRTYPTPPLSPLSATGRYHPYSKPQLMPTTSSLVPPPPSIASSLAAAAAGLPTGMHHPSFAQYFSPYSMYGPPSRIGQSHP